jgi:translocation and assembly module TamB
MRRRVPLLAASLVAAFIAAIAALPWWLKPVLVQVGRPWGAHFGAYERIGYTRFALRDVEVRQPGVRVMVARVEADTPLVWLWRRWTRRPGETRADRWTVTVERENRSTVAPATPMEGGWIPLRARLMGIATGLDRWLPRAKVGAGMVRWPGGGLSLASATWTGRTLAVENLAFGPLKTAVTLAFPVGTKVLRLTARMIETNGTANLESRGATVAGDVTWWEQRAVLDAHFGEDGWLPTEATLQTDGWTVPGARLRLDDLYAAVRGRGKVEWHDGHFDVDVAASGEPADGKSAPPLEATLRGHGDGQRFTLEALHVTLPGITAQLSEPVTVDRQAKFLQSAARFTLQADLAKQPWFAATGMVSGEARLVAGVAQSPVVDFNFEARDVAVGNVALSAASAQGRFDWPRVEITAGSITMAGGEKIAWRGGWDFRAKEILDASGAGQIRRATLVRWLPAQPDYGAISFKAQVSGPLASLTHAGSARADGVKLRGLNPLALALTWRGRGDTIESFTAEVTAGTTKISAAGAATRMEMSLSRLTFARGDATHLKLTAPATIRWNPALQIDGLQLAGGGDLGAAVMWGATGRIEIAMHKILSTWFEELAPLPGPGWQVDSLAITGGWDRGPMTFSVTGNGAINLGSGRMAAVAMALKGNQDGLRAETLRATEGTTTIFMATGRAPIVLSPGAIPFLQIEPDGALTIEAATDPKAAFWGKLAELTGIDLKEPQVTAHVTGTWARPQGEIRVTAARLALDQQRFQRPLPAIESLDVVLTGDRSGLKLTAFSVSVEGQAVRAHGQLPMAHGGWSEWSREPLAFAWRWADLHLEVPDADLAAFARFLPPYLEPKGRLQADLNYTRGGAMEGFLHLRDAASRPLGPLGVLQEITADVQLLGRTVELRSVAAKAGGQPVTLSGTIQFPADAAPRYDVALHGENLPFVRQPGLLVRGDLDLKLHTPPTGPTALSGTVRLRDSLFLSDVRAFLPGGTKSGERQPPYFAVATTPFDTWTLGVDVSGGRFLRLRTPVFNGMASARFHLGGTLGEPRLIGDVTIDEGQVLMPFASFLIKQGTVRIAEENPHELALFLRGTGRRNGYELAMEITGTVEAPSIVFTSSPALDSEQLLRMVMTGAVPSNDITYSSTQRFARLGTYLGQSLLGSFGGDAISADRLSIASGEKVSEQGRETYDVEYKLAARWKWVGEYDEFDDYNMGLKWRLYPGPPKPEAPRDAAK